MANYSFRFSTDGDTERSANVWVTEFGADAGWHIARKIDELAAWGDPAGAAALRRVQKVVARNQAPAFAGVQRFLASIFETTDRAGAALAALGRSRPHFGQARGR